MKVELISYTQDALTLLLRTKNTRLSNDDDPADWDEDKRMEHLEYMRDTIKSSWEFVDFVFSIEDVTRAFTHQLVRTRTGTYAQQSMRATDVRDQPVLKPDHVFNDSTYNEWWNHGVRTAIEAYGDLVDAGCPIQDARGILPIAVTGNIMVKFNLHTLSEMAKVRLCTRTQGEYQDVFRAMREAVIAVYPWTAEFLEVHCVATGTCAFPRYGKEHCDVYFTAMDNSWVRERAGKIFWAMRQEANPRAVDGVSVS